MSTVDQAEAYAAELTAAGVPTFVDPRKAAANLPCVLILPPSLTWDRLGGTPSIAWRLAVIARGPAGLDTWRALDDLLALLADQVALTSAEPGSYTLTGADPLPCYAVTAATE